MVKRLAITVGILLTALCSMPTSAQATTIIFNTSDSQFDAGTDNQGWWSGTQSNVIGGSNYFTGQSTLLGEVHFLRNFFTFDLSTLNLSGETITSVTLEVIRGIYDSAGANETIEFFDVSTDAATLNNNAGTSTTIFNDLGSGTSYGSFVVAAYTSSGTETLTFSLNTSAFTNIALAAGGFFSIGGALQSFGSPTAGGEDALFGGTSSEGIQRLIIETTGSTAVPEPTSMLLLGTGLIGAGIRRYGQRRR